MVVLLSGWPLDSRSWEPQLQMEIEGQPTLTLNAGDPFLMPPRTPHNALDLGPETGRMLSAYIVEVGESLATFARWASAGVQRPGSDGRCTGL